MLSQLPMFNPLCYA